MPQFLAAARTFRSRSQMVPSLLLRFLVAGSTSLITAYARTVACINANPRGSNLSGITSIPINFTILAGDVISCVITNTDNVTVTNVQVKDQHGSPAVLVPLGAAGITSETLTTSDPLGAAASLPDAVAGDGIWSKLAPSASVTFTWAHVVIQAQIDQGKKRPTRALLTQ